MKEAATLNEANQNLVSSVWRESASACGRLDLEGTQLVKPAPQMAYPKEVPSGGRLCLRARRRANLALPHGPLPHPERVTIRLIFLLLNRKHLAAIFIAGNYPPREDNGNRSGRKLMHSTSRASAELQRQRESPASQPAPIRQESSRSIPLLFALSSHPRTVSTEDFGRLCEKKTPFRCGAHIYRQQPACYQSLAFSPSNESVTCNPGFSRNFPSKRAIGPGKPGFFSKISARLSESPPGPPAGPPGACPERSRRGPAPRPSKPQTSCRSFRARNGREANPVRFEAEIGVYLGTAS
jgi:hypothetical protein